ncbi:MAG TPA: OsmC family protein [Gemmatimonadaceae bacterium]|nr:OsmC family protein [Gemmatimonadaceae bacterium]
MAKPHEVIVRAGERGYVTEITAGGHLLIADQPASGGGSDAGPTPYDYLLASLGACTAMTLRIVADRRGWPLEGVTIRLLQSRVYKEDCENCAVKAVGIDQIEREIDLAGPLSEEQQEGLLQIADRCPVGQTLGRGLRIVPARLIGDDGVAEGDARYS